MTAVNVRGTDTGKFNGRSVLINDLLKLIALIIGNTVYCVHILIFFVFHHFSRIYICG
jgi:hypothetical protein